MPNSVLPFHINNCKVTPNGGFAQLSKSGSDDLPNQGTWKNNDKDYDYVVTLPEGVWELAPGQPRCANSLIFRISKGQTSCAYQLLTSAPDGPNSYTLARADGEKCLQVGGEPQDPEVIINS